MSDMIEVEIRSDFHSAEDLRHSLEDLRERTGGEFELASRKDSSAFRMEPVLLVALITAGSSVLTTLISKLFDLISEKKQSKSVIRVTGTDGTVLEIPGDASPEQLQEYLATLSSRRVREILLAPR